MNKGNPKKTLLPTKTADNVEKNVWKERLAVGIVTW